MTVRPLCKSPLAACVALAFAIACSSERVDFFAPGEGGDTGGIGGTAGDSANGGSADAPGTGGSDTAGTGASAGSSSGGSDPIGGTGGDAMGGTAGDGMGGDAMGGTAGDGMGGDAMGGTAGDGMGGAAGDAMGGTAGSSGAGSGGASVGGTAGTAGQGGATGGAGGSDNCVPVDEVCDGLDNDCNGTPDEGSTCPASCSGNTHADHVYILCSFENGNNELSWTQANARCDDRGLVLVQIDDEAENDFLVEWIVESGLAESVWMGANDLDRNIVSREGMWVWGTGNSATQFWMGDENGRPVMSRFNAWASGEPDNGGTFIGTGQDCGTFDPDEDWEWTDETCSNDLPNFICESAAATTQ